MGFEVEKPQVGACETRLDQDSGAARHRLTIGLINNMPDTALESTELQFSRLLAAASGERDVRLRLSYLPEVARGPEARFHLKRAYWPLETLWLDPPDALIVTGAEPIAPKLSLEPYWERFAALVEWADRNVISTVWSCLAAHAAVQHLTGIERRRLPKKLSGVYEHDQLVEHPLNRGVLGPVITPQSRWNDLPMNELQAAGYSIASSSSLSGANVFTLEQRSFMVFLQGHPEYDEGTLLREYRRDVTRFLSGSQDDYPTLPYGYVSEAASQRLQVFRNLATADKSAEWAARFPFEAELREVKHTWKNSSIALYENWLSYLAEGREARQKWDLRP